ncbi:MAG: D-alanyl-D-alanine carboxypeptidase/D-alanyl-D-alanine-endopeptidase [Methanospirillum sp.]|nr:D-alanyl-D-alanine carboxypeptidase/D-alanyl-D-alanine-endopeptidase [Methanospirillum sp.]
MSSNLHGRLVSGFFMCILLFICLVCTGNVGADQATTNQSLFETQLLEITDAPRYAHASWGIIVYDPETGQTLYDKNADEMFVPASTTKIFSSASVLEALGPDYRFTTPVYATAASNGSGIDLVLVASGDPTMGGRTLPDGTIEFMNTDHCESNGSLTTTDPLSGLEDLARQVKASGITTVSDVIIDDRLFGNVQLEYMDILTPIIINDNRIDLSITSGASGSAPSITMRPETAAFSLVNNVTYGPPGTELNIIPLEGPEGTIVASGTMASDAGIVNTTFSVPVPAAFARTLFIEALEREGIDVNVDATGDNPGSKLPAAEDYADSRKVAELISPPLSEDVKLTMKVSQNLHANQYIMLLALSDNKTGYYDGMKKEGDILRSLGLNTSVIALGDGAGGDRVDRVTPRAVAELLTLISKKPYAETYLKAQPVLGVDGTLASHCKAGNTGCGKVYAKTGTSPWPDTLNEQNFLLSKGLAGYVDTKSGKRLVFAEYVNNAPFSESMNSDIAGIDLGSIAGLIYEYY